MDTKKKRENPLPPLSQTQVKKMSKAIAKQANMDEDEVARFINRYWYKMFLELKLNGKADFLGVGYLLLDEDSPQGGYKLVRFSEEQIRMKRQLNLQQQFGGALGDVGGPPAKEVLHVHLDVDFPLEELIGQIAEYRDVPADRLKQKFQAQLERAYVELIETGAEARLPDFGVIRYTDGGGLTDVEFDINEEVAKLFEEQDGDK